MKKMILIGLLAVVIFFIRFVLFLPIELDAGGYRDTNGDGKIDTHYSMTRKTTIWEILSKKYLK